MNDNTIISTIPNGHGREVRIAISQFKGRDLLDVRQWLEIDGEWKATQKGISLQTANAIILADGIQKAANELTSMAEAHDRRGGSR